MHRLERPRRERLRAYAQHPGQLKGRKKAGFEAEIPEQEEEQRWKTQ